MIVFQTDKRLQGPHLCLESHACSLLFLLRIQTRQAEQLMDKRLVVVVDSWPADSIHPQGHYVRTLGVIGDKDTETVGTVKWGTHAPRHVYSMCTPTRISACTLSTQQFTTLAYMLQGPTRNLHNKLVEPCLRPTSCALRAGGHSH
jgi:hypothetical protein